MAILYPVLVKITSTIEKIVAIIAPHRCLGCSIEDNVLCVDCQAELVVRPAERCMLPVLGEVSVGSLYTGVTEKLIHMLKFGRARSVAVPLARVLITPLPFSPNLTVVPIPTVASRARQRGYDQAELIAKLVAQELELDYSPALARARDSRQVGASRAKRQAQMSGAFYLARGVEGKNILLIDDVCTTGATLTAAAELLLKSGANSVRAAVCAWQPPHP